MSFRSFHDSLQGPGLTTVLQTSDYGCWDEVVASTLGHHRSCLLSTPNCFRAQFRCGQVNQIQVIHVKGTGQLELVREQRGHAVLWIPIRGISEEYVNGIAWLAEPGTAMLFRPGDHLHGRTSEEIEGVSILIPEQDLPPLQNATVPLLKAGPINRQFLQAGQEVSAAAAQGTPGSQWSVDMLLHNLRDWVASQDPERPRERITAVRRRAMVGNAREWMELRLGERFSVTELSAALEVSTRQLQYSFQEELGWSPMAEAKRLRLHRLRRLLQDPELSEKSVAQLMECAGLLASGVTAADYRAVFGELPRRSRGKKPFTFSDLRVDDI